MKSALLLWMLALLPVFGQSAAQKPPEQGAARKQATTPGMDAWSTKTFEIKYVDPELLRELFSGRSFVMEANRDLKTLTATGSPAFLKEVEDAVKRFDVPPALAADIEVTVYLLATAAQAPLGSALPPSLAAIGKEIKGARLADSQMVRVRDGFGGETTDVIGAPTSARLARVRFQLASTLNSLQKDKISLNGLQIWLKIPAGSPGADTGQSQLNTAPDITANVNVSENQAVIVAKTGVDKPVVVAVQITLAH